MPLEYDTDYPISTLNHDILYRIFSLNANDHEYLRYPKGAFSPLTITRRCSQVCVLWRDIIVGAASIWGSCIELDMLAQRRSDWRDEVLRRTSGARLSIYVHRVNAIHQSGIMHTLLVDLLQNHWERIRVLNIAITSPEDIRDARILNALGRPAPVLEEFMIQCSEEVTELSVTGSVSQGFHLFSNDAPALTRFSLICLHPITTLSTRTFLTSVHLKELCLFQPVELSTDGLLATCAQMPLLEKLAANITRLLSETSHTSSSNLGGHRSRVALPRLKKIDINCPNPDIYSQFLVYIAIQPECSISIEVGLDDTSGLSDRVPRNVKEMGRLVVQHLTDGFNHRCDASASVTHIILTIHPHMVHLASWCGFITRFRLKSSLNSGKIPLNIFNSILTSLSLVHFPDTIQEVRLVLFDVSNDLQNIYPGSLQSDEDNRQYIISSILQLFQALGSTVDLYVSFQSLMSLVKLSESHAGVLFPYLKNLHFSSREGEDESLYIIPFLTRRQLPHISPLRTLYFEHIASGRDLRYLDNFEGLEVIR